MTLRSRWGLVVGTIGLAWLLGLQTALGQPPVAAAGHAAVEAPTSDSEQIAALLEGVAAALRTGDAEAFRALLAPGVDADVAARFTAIEVRSGVTRTVVKERDRQVLVRPRAGYRVMVDAFIESGDRARVATWQFDLVKDAESGWRIGGHERLSAVDNLYRLSLNASTQYAARNFEIRSEDLSLVLEQGSVFTIETDRGVTGLVMTGRGTMRFEPTPATEKGQVRVFAGREVLETRFDTAYIRFADFESHADPSVLLERGVDARELRRADEVFQRESPKTYVLDLADLSSESWSLLPGEGDFLAEVRTRRWDTLTYARSAKEAEDISVFDRAQQRNISVYASAEKLATRGRFYDEDDFRSYDLLNYDIDVAVDPQSLALTGRARLRMRVVASSIGQLALRLADSLVVQSVVSEEFGRLFHLRVRGQNTLYVNLPATIVQDTDLTLTIAYAGRLAPQAPDTETQGQTGRDSDPFGFRQPVDGRFATGEAKYLYSNRTNWYPQAPVTDYVSSATMRISVPPALSAVASGELSSDSPQLVRGLDGRERKVYLFTATRPVRYLAFLVSRLMPAGRLTLALDEETVSKGGNTGGAGSGLDLPPSPVMAGAVNNTLDLAVEANPLQVGRGRELLETAADIATFYQTIVGDSPYESFTLALVENALPGGHSPAYFATLHQPLPATPFVWRTDPANFEGFPEFFLAHELAHQWWGQAVAGRNYHEQWLSEGFAQYFAALYAQHHEGDQVFANILRQLRRWSLERSDQGPIYLGYRIGHVKNDSRTFRAIIYNKGAAVLHMLRRLLGDEAFFRGLRRFYVGARFSKVGTDDLRFAMEAESGKSLDRFFDRWIYGASLPDVSFSHRVLSTESEDGQELLLRFDQRGEIFDFPATVRIEYADRRTADIVVPVTERTVEMSVPLAGPLRGVTVLEDDGTLAEIR